jgi:hypothetical protein
MRPTNNQLSKVASTLVSRTNTGYTDITVEGSLLVESKDGQETYRLDNEWIMFKAKELSEIFRVQE